MTDSNFNDFVDVKEDRLGKDQAYLLNSNKLRTELNWEDKISLKDGLFNTMKWIDDNLTSIKKLSFDYKHKV